MTKKTDSESLKLIPLVVKLITTKKSDVKKSSDKKHLSFDRSNKSEVVLQIDPKLLTTSDLYVSLVTELQDSKEQDYVIDFDSFVTTTDGLVTPEALATILTSAVNMGLSKIAFSLKTTKPKVKKHRLKTSSKYKKLVGEMQNLADAQTFTRMLQDMPSNYLNPEKFVEHVKKQFAGLESKVKITVLGRKELLKKKMGLICGVAQGSEIGPRMIVLEYNSDPKAKRLALVGKGVCFDTGGYNVKPGSHMSKMKFDMSGAAAVAGAIYALAKNGVKTNVVGVLGMVENLLSLNSYRPDDVLTSYQGLTVEIDNTDAEGRLVLGDCLAYAHKDLKADRLLSVATLTGAVIYCLGQTYAGCWTTTDQEWEKITEAAKTAGEGVWRLPFHNSYFKPLKSGIADLKNSASNPNAPSSRAAMFLKEFSAGLPYIHLDIAGLDSFTNGLGTGPMVRTLYHLAKLK